MVSKEVRSLVEDDLCPAEEKPEAQKLCGEEDQEEDEDSGPQVGRMPEVILQLSTVPTIHALLIVSRRSMVRLLGAV